MSDMNSPKMQDLTRMKRVATSLLVIVTVVFLLVHNQHNGVWPWVAAFCEAAMVGALADWFAVVALFRRPLGLPIPHTAILPRNKNRVADNLAVFVRDRFLGTDVLLAQLRAFDPLAQFAAWLRQPVNAEPLAATIATVLTRTLDRIDVTRIQTFMLEAVRAKARRVDLGRVTSQMLNTVTEDQRHQALLDEGLKKIVDWLDQPNAHETVAALILRMAEKEYPTLIGALGFVRVKPEDLGARIANSMMNGLKDWLGEIIANPQHPYRQRFDDTIHAFFERMKTDPAWHARLDNTREELLQSAMLADAVADIWVEFRAFLSADLADPASALRREINAVVQGIGTALIESETLRATLNVQMEQAIRNVAPELREGIASHIATTVRQWDDEALVREAELSLGRDLQFIRVNGALVGGLVGLLLHLLTLYAA